MASPASAHRVHAQKEQIGLVKNTVPVTAAAVVAKVVGLSPFSWAASLLLVPCFSIADIACSAIGRDKLIHEDTPAWKRGAVRVAAFVVSQILGGIFLRARPQEIGYISATVAVIHMGSWCVRRCIPQYVGG